MSTLVPLLERPDLVDLDVRGLRNHVLITYVVVDVEGNGLAAMSTELIRTEHLVRQETPSGKQQLRVAHAGQDRYTELGNGGREVRHGGR